MSFFHGLRYRLRVLFRPGDHEREIAEQVEHHLELEARQVAHVANTPSGEFDAPFAARRRFGNVTNIREETRRESGLAFFDTLRQDTRFALRTFGRNKGFTAITVMTLALGIGANTAIFSAVNTFLLRALPFREPDRLMSLSLTVPPLGANPAFDDLKWSWPKFETFRADQQLFSSLTLWMGSMFTVRRGDVTLRINGEYADAAYLPTLGIEPLRGRNFLPEENTPGGPPVAILSVGLWDQLFNRDPAVLGHVINVDGFAFTVVGVAPASFRGASGEATLWMPIAAMPEGWGRTNPSNHLYFAVGRLADGVSAARAKAVMVDLGRRVDVAWPERRVANLHLGATARSLNAARVDEGTRRIILVLFGAVGLVLLIACANVANLFLVRASGRRREIAVRLAIGAARGRLIRQLLAESVLLSVMGGVASVVVAWAGVRWLDSLQLATVLRTGSIAGLGTVSADSIRLDPLALGFTAILAIVAGLVFGLVPALQATRPSLTETLKDDGAMPATGRRRLTTRNVLVVAEIAIAIVLLTGAGLTIRSLGELLAVRPGFEPGHVLTLRVNRAPAWARDSISRFYDVGIDRLAATPGVLGVAMIDCPPMDGCGGTRVSPLDRPAESIEQRATAGVHWITPGWPALMKVPLLKGRMFDSRDRAGGQRVALISQTAARLLWPNLDPIGRTFSMDENRRDTLTVVGVLGDVLFGALENPARPEIYQSYFQTPLWARMMFFIRTSGDPLAVANATRAALNEVAPGFPVYDVMSMDTRVAGVTAYARFSALLLGLFAALALGLASLGTYGVISFAVAQRRQEIGIRIALGASRADVLRLVVGQGIVLAVIGSVCGLLVAFAATRVLTSLLYHVAPTDPVTLVTIVAVLVAAVITASWLPARRAASVPAMLAMRAS